MPASSSWVIGSANSSASPASSSRRLAVRPVTSRNTESARASSVSRRRPASSAHDLPEQGGLLLVQRAQGGVGDGDDLDEGSRARASAERPQPVEQRHLAEQVARLHERHHRLAAVDRLVGDGDATATRRRTARRPRRPRRTARRPGGPVRDTAAARSASRSSGSRSRKSSVLRSRLTSTGADTLLTCRGHDVTRAPRYARPRATYRPGRSPVSVWTIVVAAGSGTRFGGAKQFVTLRGRRVLDWSLAAAADVSDGVVVVLPPRRSTPTSTCPPARSWSPVGPRRSASVRDGLAAVPADAEVVVVHDAARPLASARAVRGRGGRRADRGRRRRARGGGDRHHPPSRPGGTVDRAGSWPCRRPRPSPPTPCAAAHATDAEATDDATPGRGGRGHDRRW